MPVSGAANAAVKLYVTPVLSTSTATLDFETLAEQPYTKHVYGNMQWGPKLATCSNYMSSAKIWGDRMQTAQTDLNFVALMSANPSAIWYWRIAATAFDDASTPTTTYTCEIEMTFYSELSGRLLLGVS